MQKLTKRVRNDFPGDSGIMSKSIIFKGKLIQSQHVAVSMPSPLAILALLSML